jgi:hypothetical protein
LASFLEYAGRKLPNLSKTMNSKLVEPWAVNTIASTACQSPLDGFLKFLRTASIAAAVVAAIDRDEWDRSRLASNSEQPDYFSKLTGMFKQLGRPELAEAPACALINTAEPQDWHAPGIGLNHLSHVMRLGRMAGPEAVLRFLNRIATPAWLGEMYHEVPSYGIAACLFALWGYYEKSVLDHFCIEALKSRVAAEMRDLQPLAAKNVSRALELLGCAALTGVYVDRSKVIWPNVNQVCEAIRFLPPKDEMVTIGHIQIQLWLGLREMARLRPDRIVVQAESGDQILALWKHSTGNTDKQKALNVWMIDWLERCAKSRWMLIPDDAPFAETIMFPGHR